MSASSAMDNELDIRALFCLLWRKRGWIIAPALLTALLAFLFSFLIKPVWHATAILERPTLTMLAGYYERQHFLETFEHPLPVETPSSRSLTDDVYQVFLSRLSSWDTRRDFWRQSNYYRQRKSGNAKSDAALLNTLIGNIIFTPGDPLKKTSDTVILNAQTASQANQLLRQYVAFADERARHELHEALNTTWRMRVLQLQDQIKRQESVAQALYQRQRDRVAQALKIADQHGKVTNELTTFSGPLPDADLSLLGRAQLQVRLENLQASGPDYDADYERNKAMLMTLNASPVYERHMQTFRYLRTPEEPLSQDRPRRLFLMLMWGIVGAIVGAGIVLVHGPGGLPFRKNDIREKA